MKITFQDADMAQLGKLLDMKYLNLEAGDFYNAYLANDYLSVTPDAVKELTKSESMSAEDAFFTALLLARDIAPEDSEVVRMKDACHIDRVTQLNPRLYDHVSYATDLALSEKKTSNWELSYNYYAPYEGFLYDDVSSDPENYFAEINHLGFFPTKVPYLCVSENNVVWMSITPYEINTMAQAIQNAHGKVVTFGLGLGYFAYSVLNKADVSQVIVVEKDPKVIRLFQSEILPKIRLRNKLTIVQDNAFDYAKNKLPREKADYVFVDIYHDADDALPIYLKLKALEKLSPATEFSYWIERGILCYLRRFLMTLIEENLSGYTAEDYVYSENESDTIMNALAKALSAKEFTSYQDLKLFLTDSELKEFVKSVTLA
ncbi:MAG: hypothetical protein LKM30_09255 [Bacilli bacterium]|jgi:hypothetical protein|nr:hypothetical protein [Bacilli bacterium]